MSFRAVNLAPAVGDRDRNTTEGALPYPRKSPDPRVANQTLSPGPSNLELRRGLFALVFSFSNLPWFLFFIDNNYFPSPAIQDPQYDPYERTESQGGFLLKVTRLNATSGIRAPYDSTALHKYRFINYDRHM